MPVIKSAIKRMRQNEKRAAHNLRIKNRMKATIKEFTKLAASDSKKAEALLPQVYSQIDRAAKRNIYHKNKAARMKGRLAKMVAKDAPAKTTKSKAAAKKTPAKKTTTKPR